MFVEGEFLDTVCGIPNSRTEIVMLKPPDDGTRLELSGASCDPTPCRAHRPPWPTSWDCATWPSRSTTCRQLSIAIEGYGLVGGIGEYEGVWRMAYVRARRDRRLAGRAHRLSQRPHLPPTVKL